MIPYRTPLTILLFAIAIISGILLPDWWGMIVAPIFIVLALLLWIIPQPGRTKGDEPTDPQLQRTSQLMLGAGLGLLAAVILPFLPPLAFWAAMGVGLLAIFYFAVQLFRQ